MNSEVDSLRKMIHLHIQRFNEHLGKWEEHEKQSEHVARSVEEIHSNMKLISQSVQHLSNLPAIASGINSLRDGLLHQNGSLSDQVGKIQTLVFRAVLTLLMLLGSICLVLILKETDFDFSLPGVNIKGNHNNPTRTQ